MNNQEIIEKIKNLTPKTMILTMVNGLRNRHTRIQMDTFGFKNDDGVCFGCAATNALCELGADPSKLPHSLDGSCDYGFSEEFDNEDDRHIIDSFEVMIDTLRRGFNFECDVIFFNDNRAEGKLSHLKLTNTRIEEIISPLLDDYTDSDLRAYERFANTQE